MNTEMLHTTSTAFTTAFSFKPDGKWTAFIWRIFQSLQPLLAPLHTKGAYQ